MPATQRYPRESQAGFRRRMAALAHEDRPGAGAAKRRKVGLRGRAKIPVVLHEFKHRTLRSGGSGKIVRKRDQAIAIALSEARESGANIPLPRKRRR